MNKLLRNLNFESHNQISYQQFSFWFNCFFESVKIETDLVVENSADIFD